MGYVRKPRVYLLRFADPEFEGLEVRATSLPIGQLLEVAELADSDSRDAKHLTALFDAFATVIVDWNLEREDGSPVPATTAGMFEQDLDFMMALIRAWMEAVASVPAPLPIDSSGTEPFPEESIPMELLSGSLLS